MSNMKLSSVISLTLLFATNSIGLSNIDSDSPNYDSMYDTLVAEYEEGLHVTTTTKPVPLEVTFETDDDEENPDSEILPVSIKPVEEMSPWTAYQEKTHRLKCDNPWFWNTIQCVWLDYKYKNVTARTIRNRKVALILIGIISFFVILPICSFFIMLAYFKAQVKKHSIMIEKYMNEYGPGSIVLPNGEVKEYDPTPGEEEALEDLIECLTSVV